MECKIDVHKHHPVKFIEDLKSDREKEAICEVCEDPSSGPCYKCSVCNFLCHESCGHLPSYRKHPLHPDHVFRLSKPVRNSYCYACNKSCKRCYFYNCESCEFSVDTKCVSRLRANKDDGHQHAFLPLLKHIQFTCEGCGEECKDMGSVCNKCQFLTHTRCALFSQTIKVAGHGHSLSHTYSIQQVKEEVDIVCEACSEKVNIEYAAYYCQQCSYVAHLRCARERQTEEDMTVNQLFSEGNQLGLIENMNQAVNTSDQLEKIQHFSHPHDLILNHGEVPNNKVCDACMQLISIPFYYCIKCEYCLHGLCATITTKLTKPGFSKITCTVLSQALTVDGVFQCKFCNHYRHGFACVAEGTMETYDVQCVKIDKFRHKGHPHPFSAFQRTSYCKFCRKITVLVCSQCDFALCHGCITLPLVFSHKDDEHLLELTYATRDKSGEYYCLICEGKRYLDHWFYYCAKCDFIGHCQCVLGEFSYIKIEKTYKDERYQHPLTFVRKINDSHPCTTCGLPFGDMLLQCDECKLKIHPRFGFNFSTCLKLWVEGKTYDKDEDGETNRDEQEDEL